MKILLVQTGFLGDVVLSTPVISALRSLYPQAEICVMTTPQSQELVRFHPAQVSTIAFAKRGADSGFGGLMRMAKRLRAEQFDIVFSLHKSWRTAVLLWLAGIKTRYGFAEASATFLYSKTVPRKDCKHEVERNLAILRAIGKDPQQVSGPLSLGISPEAIAQADALLAEVSQRKLIGIAPGSVWATKRWTPEGFAVTADALAAQGYLPVLLGGPADSEAAMQVQALMQTTALNLVGKCSLLVSAEIIRRVALLISNDSAPLHLASAMQTPVVAAFCATVPEFGFGPWQVASRVVGVEGLTCRPCGRHGGNICPTGTHACQKDLLPEQVLQASKQLLEARHE